MIYQVHLYALDKVWAQAGGSPRCGLHKVSAVYTCYSSKDCVVFDLVGTGRRPVVERIVVVAVDHTVVVVAVAVVVAVGDIVVHCSAVVQEVAIPLVFVGAVLRALLERLVPWPGVEHRLPL